MLRSNVFAIACFVFVGMAGCSYHRDKSGNPVSSDPSKLGSPNELSSLGRALGYAAVREKVFAPLCLGCHRAGSERASFETYESTKQWIKQIDAMVPRQMPPGKSMSEDELRTLKAWILAGAPEKADAPTSNSPEPPRPAPTTPEPALDRSPPDRVPDYALVRARVIEPLCISCHRSISGRANFETYESKKLWIDRIAAVVPASMPPNKKISPEELALLKSWIAAGAPRSTVPQVPEPTPSPLPSPSPVASAPPRGPSRNDVPAEYRWSNFRVVVLEKSCLQCHAGEDAISGVDLSTLDRYRANSKEALDRVLKGADEDSVMPPSGEKRLTNEQMRILVHFYLNRMTE